jgi:hypothetical protein
MPKVSTLGVQWPGTPRLINCGRTVGSSCAVLALEVPNTRCDLPSFISLQQGCRRKHLLHQQCTLTRHEWHVCAGEATNTGALRSLNARILFCTAREARELFTAPEEALPGWPCVTMGPGDSVYPENGSRLLPMPKFSTGGTTLKPPLGKTSVAARRQHCL